MSDVFIEMWGRKPVVFRYQFVPFETNYSKMIEGC